eukprot:495223-Rhodomonas_salina.5
MSGTDVACRAVDVWDRKSEGELSASALSAIDLRPCYAMPDTELAYGAMRCAVLRYRMLLWDAMRCGVVSYCTALCDARLCCYAVRGTEVGYGGVRCAGEAGRMLVEREEAHVMAVHKT